MLKVSWQICCSTDYIELVAPKLGSSKGLSREEQQALKQTVRDDLYSACQAQLTHKATQAFVRSMESPSPYSKSKKSVKLLLADGKELANRLDAISLLAEVDKVEFLQNKIKPYLQLGT